MIYAIAAIIVCVVGGFIWLGYKAYHAGGSSKEAAILKEGAKAGERFDEEYEKVRGNLASRIADRMRERNNSKT